MNTTVQIIFLCLILVGIQVSILVFLYVFFRYKEKTQITEDQKPALPPFQIIDRQVVASSLNDDLKSLKTSGDRISKADISTVYFVHGTFVGDDPLHIVENFISNIPRIEKHHVKRIKEGIRKSANLVARDIGNFSREYEKLFANVTHEKIAIKNFTWSSANNHLARVNAAIRLLNELHLDHTDKGSRVLLFGHSHAGQVFSLLTRIINDKKFREELKQILSTHNIVFNLSEESVSHVETFNIDMVTFGTPIRYPWSINSKMRLLHFINHRGDLESGSNIKGLFRTKSGDYVQQWGGGGSDLFSITKKQHLINSELDTLLGRGIGFRELTKNILTQNRFHTEGMHLLVDYGDDSIFPNFAKTIFGHGVYTRLELLPFHIEMIAKHLYK